MLPIHIISLLLDDLQKRKNILILFTADAESCKTRTKKQGQDLFLNNIKVNTFIFDKT
jgi:hypothetical protein